MTFEKALGDDANGLPAAPDGISDVAEVVLAWQEVSGLEATAEHVALWKLAVQLHQKSRLGPNKVAVAEAQVDVILGLDTLIAYGFTTLQNPPGHLFVDDEHLPTETGVNGPADDDRERQQSGEDEEGELETLDGVFVVLIARFHLPGVIQQGNVEEVGGKLTVVRFLQHYAGHVQPLQEAL